MTAAACSSYDRRGHCSAVIFWRILLAVYTRPALTVGAPPYPLVLAGNRDSDALLMVGPSPLAMLSSPFPSPVFFRSQDLDSGSGQPLTLDPMQRAGFLAAADLNGDQQLDQVVNWGGGTASGTTIFFEPRSPSKGLVPDQPSFDLLSGMTLVDLDGDKLPDLVRSLDKEVTVHLNKRATPGQFESPPLALLSATENLEPLGLTTGDLNGDERRDIAVSINLTKGMPANFLNIYLGDGKPGTFQRPISVNTGTSPRVAAAADLNGDFVDDVVVATYGGVAPTVIYGALNGVFQREDRTEVTVNKMLDISVGDLNGDCMPDLALVTENDPYVFVLLNKTPQ